MAQLVVRSLPESVKKRLKARAVRNGRSLEGEVREILNIASIGGSVAESESVGIGTQLIEIFRPVAGTLKIPPRSKDRPRPAKFPR
jgi:plasmid stability protein